MLDPGRSPRRGRRPGEYAKHSRVPRRGSLLDLKPPYREQAFLHSYPGTMPPDGDIATRLTINAPYGDTSLVPLFNISDVGGLWKQDRVPHADKSAWGSAY